MTDFNELTAQKALLQEKLDTLEAEESVLRGSLQRVQDERQEILAEQAALQALAEELFNRTFGKPKPVAVLVPAPVPTEVPTIPTPAPARKPDNSIVTDLNAPTAPKSKEVEALDKLGGFSF